MVSSSQVGDAISVRCDDANAVQSSAAPTTVRAISGDLATMTTPADHHLVTRPQTQGRADPVRYASATGWLRQIGLPPT